MTPVFLSLADENEESILKTAGRELYSHKISEREFRELFPYKVETLLEVGPGMSSAISELPVKNKYLLDISLNLLEYQKMHGEDVTLINADATNMPLKDSSIDGVIVVNCPELFINSFNEIMRVLKSGGRAVSYNTPDYVHFQWEDLFYEFANHSCALLYDNMRVCAKKI